MERKKKETPKDIAGKTIVPLIGKMLLGLASKEEIAELNKASKDYLDSDPTVDRGELNRFRAAEQIMEMLVAEGSEFTTSESAELRFIFYHSENPVKTLAAMRKIKSVV